MSNVSTRFLFFSGKGGVGKTSMACTTAVHSADSGERTLIVTTDPASNLADVFEQPIGHKVTPIEGVPGLWAMEIDPDKATYEYKERALAPLRALFPADVVKVMEEQMSGPCTAEVGRRSSQPVLRGQEQDAASPHGRDRQKTALPIENDVLIRRRDQRGIAAAISRKDVLRGDKGLPPWQGTRPRDA